MPEPSPTIRFVADRGDARLRLDQVLVRRVVGVKRMSRTRAQDWIDAGAVRVDGMAAPRASVRVREGAVVEIDLPDATERRVQPLGEDLPLEILYEDEHLLAIDKPAGQVVHPSYKNVSGTLVNAVLSHVRARPGARPGIVTRLDKQTSGVVVVALSPDVHARLQRDAAAGRMRKQYLAVVRGEPTPVIGEIDLPLGRDPDDRRRVVVVGRGAPSRTQYKVLATNDAASLLGCELVTGRTHQIRVHLAARGWPILGDPAYGVQHEAIARQALHAWRVRLTHPLTHEALAITAPLPADLLALLARLGLSFHNS